LIQTDRKSGGIGDLNYPLFPILRKRLALHTTFSIQKQALPCVYSSSTKTVSSSTRPLTIVFWSQRRDETLRTLQAIQHVQAHPDEVCPAGWQPGDKTMVPDPVKSKSSLHLYRFRHLSLFKTDYIPTKVLVKIKTPTHLL